MNLNLFIVAGVALLSAAFECGAADQYENKEARAEQRSRITTDGRLVFPARASDVIGKQVMNLQNETLGKVGELAVDVEAGRVVLVILHSGGILGVGAKSIAVPPKTLSYDPSTKTMRLDLDKEKFKGAVPFDMSKWEDSSPTNYLVETYRYYDQRPYFEITNNKVEPVKPGRMEKAGRIIGLPVVNKENKKCGDVNDLVVDLPAGRIVHVIVSSGGFLGIGDALNAVPPAAFRHSPSRQALILHLTKEELARAPYFKNSQWPDFNDAAYSEKIYRSYGVDPYFNAEADNTARNVRDRKEEKLTPLDQGTSEADVQTTRQIRQAIVAREDLSVNARNVKIITANGRVTLRGPVNDDAEKQAIAAIASRIAQGENVDNQIEVKREPYKE